MKEWKWKCDLPELLMLVCYHAIKREGALECGTCTQKLSARRKKHNLLLNPRGDKLRSKEEMRVECGR